jgi:hypothetical protein
MRLESRELATGAENRADLGGGEATCRFGAEALDGVDGTGTQFDLLERVVQQ